MSNAAPKGREKSYPSLFQVIQEVAEIVSSYSTRKGISRAPRRGKITSIFSCLQVSVL
jgi:hypothetical protein